MYFTKKQGKLALTNAGRNALSGYLFLLPFLIGFLAFMLAPIMESLRMVFSNVEITPGQGFNMTFTGFENLKQILLIDASYTTYNRLLIEEIGRMMLIVPAVIFFSLFVALILNQEFRARGLARAVLFLPVIISSGIMIGIETNNALLNEMAEMIRESNQMKSSITGVLEDILVAEGAASEFMAYVFLIVNQIYTIAMASGIQIIIFLSALQTIPSSVYESAKIEGATAWECFWKITFPMVSAMILVNVVYSVVDYFLRTDNLLMERISETLILNMNFHLSTTMAWVYFAAVAAIIGISIGLISRKVYYYE